MSQVNTLISKYIEQLCKESGKPIPQIIEEHNSIMEDIGLTSLEFATLISFLDTDLDVDPFMDGSIAMTDIRSVGEICHVYEEALQKKKIYE